MKSMKLKLRTKGNANGRSNGSEEQDNLAEAAPVLAVKDETQDVDFDKSTANGDHFSDLSNVGEYIKGVKVKSKPVKQRDPHNARHAPRSKVNLAKLGADTLWRYWIYYNLDSINPNPSEQEIVDAVYEHFGSQKVDENKVIDEFIKAAKRERDHST